MRHADGTGLGGFGRDRFIGGQEGDVGAPSEVSVCRFQTIGRDRNARKPGKISEDRRFKPAN
jgi:hypothetical protein